MKTTAFRYDFTMKEFAFFLFGKKQCPHCGEKLHKEKKFEITDGSVFASKSDPLFFIQDDNTKHYYYVYKCYNCNQSFTLKQLSNQNY